MKKLLTILVLIFMNNPINAETEEQTFQLAYLAGGCYWGLEELMRKRPWSYRDQGRFFWGPHKERVL